ncbi:MAG: hypothetical protein JRJ69_02070 [Deltaproteobacteria bacterium]|nr:hypothetical protein [Deltaproteobacteria bacterium]
MNDQHLLQTWEITLLSPLHIGDGEELVLNMDYRRSNTGIEVILLDDLLNELEDFPNGLSEIGAFQFDLDRFIQQYNLSITSQYTMKCSGSVPPSIRRFIKDAYGRPYVPGSSFKGALRTALWSSLDRPGLPPVSHYQDFKKAVQKISGQDPHHDFLRLLYVSDSNPLDPQGSLDLAEIKFFNLQKDSQAGWKDLASRRNKKDFRQAGGIFLEALKPGCRLFIQAVLDGFLTAEVIKSVFRIPYCSGTTSFHKLAKVINAHSLFIALSEKAFFGQFGSTTAPITAFYDNLVEKIQEVSKSPASFIIRLAWGSGWKGMTGDWIDDADMGKVREADSLGKSGCPFCNSSWVKLEKRIGKYQCKRCGKAFLPKEKWFHPVFPKTRRLAMKDGVPSEPLGWISIAPTDDEAFCKKAVFTSNPIGDSEGKTSFVTLEPPVPDPEELKAETIKLFKAAVDMSHNLPGDIDQFIGKVKAQEEEDLRRELCRILLDKAMSLPKKTKFPKALAAGKSWAKRLKALCDELGIDISHGK